MVVGEAKIGALTLCLTASGRYGCHRGTLQGTCVAEFWNMHARIQISSLKNNNSMAISILLQKSENLENSKCLET